VSINEFLQRVISGQAIDFNETITIIEQYYDYLPTEFTNGIIQPLINAAGQNEGSCKIFAFAKLQQLTQVQTLALFGDYYRRDVLGNPQGNDHMNIRQFMRDGWEGIVFHGEALHSK
jgi:hypothetical protein